MNRATWGTPVGNSSGSGGRIQSRGAGVSCRGLDRGW